MHIFASCKISDAYEFLKRGHLISAASNEMPSKTVETEVSTVVDGVDPSASVGWHAVCIIMAGSVKGARIL